MADTLLQQWKTRAENNRLIAGLMVLFAVVSVAVTIAKNTVDLRNGFTPKNPAVETVAPVDSEILVQPVPRVRNRAAPDDRFSMPDGKMRDRTLPPSLPPASR
ncbi:hypothetical protein [Longimicrobium terrae]|uniref:Uncharacterized protein n=1 Tax=Longimicrobium terrae TaxID=1639882 RepID=A0A841H384_9BACT|nr:hypothetical protein [Longimicrobium terrae]MBB4637846.1 hypothetical protein [Longimicrobium terrae]MBB6072299.1 hypothetical protein [Longimicrobium terrae]NNC31219.1 hypothetical protein [Longimicrobium terrae]